MLFRYRSRIFVALVAIMVMLVAAGCGGAPAVPAGTQATQAPAEAAATVQTADATGEATVEATTEQTAEATAEETVEATADSTVTAEATVEATAAAEATTGTTETAEATETVAAAATTATAEATEAPFDPAGANLVVYSGRNEELVGPLIERFEQSSGIEVAVRYGDTAELASTILDEGANSPADVFFSQDAGALGALAQADVLAPLDASVLDRVDARFRSSEGLWVGVSGRARTVVYNTEALQPSDLPTSIRGFTDPRWKGKIGWAPTNASFQAFVTALRRLDGEEQARAWLEAVQANEPKVYKNNTSVVEAVAAGEVEVGFVNHYYLMRLLAEKGESYGARNHFFGAGDPGSLVNVAGAGILRTSEATAAAQQFLTFLLNEESQQYFSSETYEYPLVAGVGANPGLPAIADLQTPELDLSNLEDLEGTLELLQEVGIL